MTSARDRARRRPWGAIAYLMVAAAWADALLRLVARPLAGLERERWAYAAGALALMLGQAALLDRLAGALAVLDR